MISVCFLIAAHQVSVKHLSVCCDCTQPGPGEPVSQTRNIRMASAFFYITTGGQSRPYLCFPCTNVFRKMCWDFENYWWRKNKNMTHLTISHCSFEQLQFCLRQRSKSMLWMYLKWKISQESWSKLNYVLFSIGTRDLIMSSFLQTCYLPGDKNVFNCSRDRNHRLCWQLLFLFYLFFSSCDRLNSQAAKRWKCCATFAHRDKQRAAFHCPNMVRRK